MKKRKTELPKISVIIPSYNKTTYIKQTLKSLVDQNYSNLEVIIQDGGSTDGSVGIISSFAKKYPKIFQWVSKKDSGQVDAINKGIKKATGEIVTYINADDVYKKGALIQVAQAYLKNPEALWYTGYGDIIDGKANAISAWVTNYKNILLNINKLSLLLTVNYISQPSTFLTKKAYQQYGPFKGTKKYVMEYELWLKLAKVQMPILIKTVLSSFRLTTDNISATSFHELLSLDYKIASRYTKNKLILCLHFLNNTGRTGLIGIMKAAKF